MAKRNDDFWSSLFANNATYNHYWRRLVELALSRFQWTGLPETVDARFLEMALFTDGMCIFFKDEEIGYLGLRCLPQGAFNVYNVPISRVAYASNSYQKHLTDKDSVIIYNNMLRMNNAVDILGYATRLYEIERTIDTNIKMQKTPAIIRCDEAQRLTLINLFKKYEGNVPFIYASKDLDMSGVDVIDLKAPYIADKLQVQLEREWNEALTCLGISNVSFEKKERVIRDEVERQMGGILASRNSALEARRQACRKINDVFGLDVWCDFRDEQEGVKSNEGGGIV